MRWWDGAGWSASTTVWAPPSPSSTSIPTPAPNLTAAGAVVAVADQAPWEAAQADLLARRFADYQKVSGWLWIAIAVVQIITVLGAIAGVWNLVVGITRILSAKKIRARHSDVPKMFEGVAWLVVIAIINVLLGAVVGIALVAVDFWIRDRLLKSAHIFTEDPGART